LRADVIPNTPTPAWDGRDLADLLELAPVGAGRFRSRFGERNENGRLYGGQLLGQAVMAAARTVPADRSATYLQFLFAAGGIPEQAVDYEVTALQDGKRFASRSVRGAQAGGRIVCDVGVSFARLLEAPSHGSAAPADSGIASDPAGLPGLKDIDAPEARDVERTLAYGYHDHPVIDLRLPFVDDVLRGDPAGPRVRFWVRVRPPLGDDPALHAAAFAYISDYWINFAACIAHVRPAAESGGKLYVASLNHTLWLHAPFRADGWLLFDCVSPRAAFGRGLAIARVYTQAGEMVASATQECLLAPA
jgi:acyl-CoA thioesterase II